MLRILNQGNLPIDTELIKRAKQTIPVLQSILELTWEKLKFGKQIINKNFSKCLVDFDSEATILFKRYERKAILNLAYFWIEEQEDEMRQKFRKMLMVSRGRKFVEQASRLFTDFAILVQAMEKDLGNMRKARGGRTFELTISKLLLEIGIRNELPTGKSKEVLKRIDVIVPGIEKAMKLPEQAAFLTCKRTLRERWKSEVPQARLNQRFYLITIDDNLSQSKAKEINEKGLIAFVRNDIYSEKFKGMSWIRKLSDLPKTLRTL